MVKELTEKQEKVLRWLYKPGFFKALNLGGNGQIGILQSAKALVRRGLVHHMGSSKYTITKLGEEWMRSRLSKPE